MHSHAVFGETKPGRWDKEMEAFLEADRAKAPKKNRTLFIGSSASSAGRPEQDFRSSVGTVIRRGFGGLIQDATRYADRIIPPYKPRQIVLYAGGMRSKGASQRASPRSSMRSLRGSVQNCRGHASRLSPSSQPQAVGQRSKKNKPTNLSASIAATISGWISSTSGHRCSEPMASRSRSCMLRINCT